MGKVYLNSRASNTIKQCLKNQGITQEVFAEDYLGVDVRTLQNYLMGKTPVAFEKIDIIQRTFLVSIEELFGKIPKEYQKTTLNIFDILRKALDVNFLLTLKRNYKGYVDWITEKIHFNSYPVKGIFRVIACKADKKRNNYYCNIQVYINGHRKIPINELFTISCSFVGRIHFDYGFITIKENYLEIRETFTKVFSDHTAPIKIEEFNKTGLLINFNTWVGEDDITFIIRSTQTDFRVFVDQSANEGEDIDQMRKSGKVVFQRAVWQK